MARSVGKTGYKGKLSAGTYVHVVPLPTTNENEVLVFCLELDSGALSSVVGDNSGTYTQQYGGVNANYMYAYTSIVSSTPDTEITLTGTTDTAFSISFTVVIGADISSGGANLVDSSTSETPTNSVGFDFKSLTTTSNDTLIIQCVGGGNGYSLRPREGVITDSLMDNTYRCFAGIYSTFQETAGATGTTHYFVGGNSTVYPTFFVMAINDGGSNLNEGYVDKSVRAFNFIHLMLEDYYCGELGDNTAYDPTSASYENISSIDNGSYTESNIIGHLYRNETINVIELGAETTTLGAQSSGGSYLGYLQLSGFPITETYGSTDNYDLTDEKIILSVKMSDTNFEPSNKIGSCFGISDKTNARFWQLGSINTVPAMNKGLFPTIIDASDSSFVMDEIGTPNENNVGSILLGSQPSQTYAYIYPSAISLMRYMTLVGGSSSIPCSFATAYKIAQSSTLNTILAQEGMAEGQYLIAHDMQVGGSDGVYWNCTNQSCEWPAATNATEFKENFKIGAAKLEFRIDASSGDVIDMSTGVFNFGNEHKFTMQATSHNSDIYTFTGRTVIGGTPTLQDLSNVDYGGLTFDSCKEITLNGADISGSATKGRVTISNGVDTNSIAPLVGATQAALQTLVSGLDNVTFLNNDVAIPISYTGAAGPISLDFTGINCNGNTVDLSYNSTNASQLTAVMEGGSNILTTSISGAATGVTISAPILTLTINSDTASTLIRYFEDDSQTVVDSTTGTTLDYDYPDSDAIDIELVKQGYVPVNRQNVTPYNGDYDVIMDLDEAYNSSHGLTITTEYDYVRATKVLTINSDQSALDIRSSLADVIRTNSSYYNTALLMDAIPGLTRVDLTDGMTITSMATWKGAGMERFDSADAVNPVEKWLAIKSVGDITGGTVRYRQTDSGSTTGLTLTNNVIDEAFQYYSDPNHDGSTADGYDYSGYMVAKSFLLGSKQGRVDVLANAGISSLSSNLYTVPLTNVDHDYSGTDPGISADITLVAGSTVGGKAFAYEIVDGGTNTGVNIADQINYNGATTPDGVIQGGTGLTWFELGDMVIHNATSVETERCLEEGTTPTYVGFYVSRSSADHPDFTRFQADDGTYYVPAVFNQASITNLPSDGANIMLQIYNVTTATPVYAADPSGTAYSDTYIEGTDYTAGDDVRIRFAELNGSTSFKSFQTNVTASATGWSLNAANFIEADSTYATNAVDGSTITKFSYTPVNDQFNLLVGQNFTAAELFSFYCATLTTAAGIEGAYGAFVAPDPGNYKNIVSVASIYLDNETTTSQRQTDSARIYRDDDTYPVLSPTTSGYGIDVNWQNVVYVVSTGGSALTAQENAWLSNASSTSTTIDSKVGTPVVDLATDISNIGGGSAPTAVEIRQEIDANSTKLDVSVGSRMAEASINTTAGAIDNVLLVNTTTTNTDMRGTDSANTIAPDNSGITQIQSDIAALNDFDPNTAIIEGSETWLQAMRLIRADAAGSIVDDDAGNYVIKSADGLKDRITGTYADSSRTITGTDVK